MLMAHDRPPVGSTALAAQPLPNTFEEFYVGTRHRVVTFLYAMGGDLTEAQDAAQEAYARAWQRWHVVGEYADPEAWVRLVGYRLLVNRWRKARSRADAHLRHGPQRPAPAPGEDTVLLVRALRGLPERQRVAIALHHLLDLPVEEVARQLGISVNTVKAQLARGRRALAVYLGADEEGSRHA
jgi:RNA polymerase sigma-70 factor (ECF subfamily)